ncbi:response regulator [Spirosoma pollinicola]|uniref:Response regulator n=1 Tax=Spirosoma pollinicola TaxID=2057025 RepID=A0A2K8Z0M8_9BACT|nr:response regulator [Spirosoma pollinicola]AUD03442.1 response regulator [Spirosoma pollinicola]
MNPNHDTDWMLIAEDQIDLWILLRAHLQRVLPDVQLVHLIDAPTALSYLQCCLIERQPLPRLILSNLYMPHLEDGLGLLTSLKEPSSSFRHLPVVMVSSSTYIQDRQEVNRRGSSYLSKPASYEEWSEFLRTLSQYWQDSLPPGKDKYKEPE